MTEQAGNESPKTSSLDNLPSFPREAENAPSVAQLPDRARSWGFAGVWIGAIVGGIIGIGTVIESIFVGSLSMSRALWLMLGLPFVLALAFGAVFGLRGLLRDWFTHSRDVAAMREAESEKPGEREWAGVKKLLERHQQDDQ